jgi:NPCBM/NEW2 domain
MARPPPRRDVKLSSRHKGTNAKHWSMCRPPSTDWQTVTATLLSLLSLTALAAPPDVTVRLLEGDSVNGRLTALSAVKLTLENTAGRHDFDTAKLMWLELPVLPTPKAATIWIDLLDGSRLNAVAYSVTEGKARIDLATGQAIEIPTRAIHTARFHQQTPELTAQWREITSSMVTYDLVVIRKTSMRTVEQGENEPRTVTEQSLDQLEGSLLDVSADSVSFLLDGDKVPIRREKLEGLVYYHPAKREFSPPLARLIDTAGSSWFVREVELAGADLKAKTSGGVPLTIPATSIAKLDFSIGNIAFLSDLEADSGIGDPPVSLQPAGMTYKFGRVFQMRSGPPLGADGFRIAGRRYENGLSLHSPAKLVYRVPEGFRWFHAVAGVDDSVISPGSFNFVVLADGKELARHAFSGEQKRQAIPLSLDIKGVRRLSIVLETADGQDIGDQLDLCEARFTK